MCVEFESKIVIFELYFLLKFEHLLSVSINFIFRLLKRNCATLST